jgi:lipoyl(octanoyl) transferase
VRPHLLPLDLGERRIPYQEGYEVQRRLHAQVVSGEAPPTVLLLEHEAVYTAGRRTQPGDLPPAGIPVVDVDRGGRITWHGPGQVVAYPIVRLGTPVDVVAYVRLLEEALMATCADVGLPTARIPGRSGVWVASDGAERKIAAIGVRVARGVTMHGVALNVDCDLAAYSAIVPCGIPDAGVTSLAAEGRIPIREGFGAPAETWDANPPTRPGSSPRSASLTEIGMLLGGHLHTLLDWD